MSFSLDQILLSLNGLPGGSAVSFIIVLIIASIALNIILALVVKILSTLAKKTSTTLDDRILKKISDYFPIITNAPQYTG